ncbi:hypothetical protein EIP91_010187 [Steccherinum ochraceum]|uniref:Uncharacterized protein n=1 Tax=Steccherinum ochraceum TaxID=92696 RepID=A0A4R0RR09_9APHY|nr:hypothetical protein EIP91_010187 [Steccherinum ochraceum]
MNICDLPPEVLSELLTFALHRHPIPSDVFRINTQFYTIGERILHSHLRFRRIDQIVEFAAGHGSLACSPLTLSIEISAGYGSAPMGTMYAFSVFRYLIPALRRCGAEQAERSPTGEVIQLPLNLLKLHLNTHVQDLDLRSVYDALILTNPQVFVWRGSDLEHHFSIAIVPTATSHVLRAAATWTNIRELTLTNLQFPARDTALSTPDKPLLPVIPSLRKLTLDRATLFPTERVAEMMCLPRQDRLELVRIVDAYSDSIWGPRIGNIKSNAIYNPNETRHPPPINAIDQERDSELEKFIRSKYEFKSYFDRSALVASKLGPSQSASHRLSSSKSGARLTPSSTGSTLSNASSPPSKPFPPRDPPTKPATPPAMTATASAALSTPARAPIRSVSQPVPPPLNLVPHPQAQVHTPLQSSTMNDLAGLQSATSNASLPLQYATPLYSAASTSMSIPTIPTTSPQSIPNGSPMTIPSLPSSSSQSSYLTAGSPYGHLSASPHSPYPSQFSQMAAASGMRSMSLGTGLSAQPTGYSMNGGSSPFQQTHMLPQASPAPSPNPFAPQMLPQSSGLTTGQQLFMNQHQQQQQPMQMYTPQPQLQSSLHIPNSGNPYLPTPSPQGSPYMATNQFTSGTPSPYAMSQPLPAFPSQPSPYGAPSPLPQMQQQQQQQSSNPFTSWIAQGPQHQQQTGYPQQQQWGGM